MTGTAGARYQLGVVGAGIVGLALAREALRRRPGLTVVVLEKEGEVAQHQSGHNSGVVHTGIYYPPGSLKARLCVEGAARMREYCQEHGLAWRELGKLIVATRPEECAGLAALLERGRANGVRDLERLGPAGIRDLEPHLGGLEAIWSPHTAITDYGAVARALAAEVRAAGGRVLTGWRVTAIARGPAAVEIANDRGDRVEVARLVTCAGLQADRVAALSGDGRDPAIVPFRGDYWLLRPGGRTGVRHLVYPVPDPALPFLGVHLTPRLSGEVWVGPNAVLATAREGYRRTDVNWADLGAALAHPGLRRLARRHWRAAVGEYRRDFSRRRLAREVRRYLPALTARDLRWGPSGVRAQALGADGQLVDDFLVEDQDHRVVHLRNAPSPAATSSLAVAALLADRLQW